jgi:AcrR family transcriptional regulator
MSASPLFHRAGEADAFALARTTFLANERIDMQTLASQLGIARATLHRWVHTRENLIDHVLGELASETGALAIAGTHGELDDRIVDAMKLVVERTARFKPIRGFVEREPALALRLVIGERFSLRQRLLDELVQLIEEEAPERVDQLRGFAPTVVEIATALVWSSLVAGDEPSGERVAAITRALLVAARAGELPARAS